MRGSTGNNRSTSIPKVISSEEINTNTLNILGGINGEAGIKSEMIIASKQKEFSPKNLSATMKLPSIQSRRESLFKKMEKINE